MAAATGIFGLKTESCFCVWSAFPFTEQVSLEAERVDNLLRHLKVIVPTATRPASLWVILSPVSSLLVSVTLLISKIRRSIGKRSRSGLIVVEGENSSSWAYCVSGTVVGPGTQ